MPAVYVIELSWLFSDFVYLSLPAIACCELLLCRVDEIGTHSSLFLLPAVQMPMPNLNWVCFISLYFSLQYSKDFFIWFLFVLFWRGSMGNDELRLFCLHNTPCISFWQFVGFDSNLYQFDFFDIFWHSDSLDWILWFEFGLYGLNWTLRFYAVCKLFFRNYAFAFAFMK